MPAGFGSMTIMSAYIYTGCDQIGKFNSISKARALTVYLNCTDDIIEGIKNLGEKID